MIDISKNELYIKMHDATYKNYLLPCGISACRPRPFDGFVYILGGSCKYTFSDKSSFETKKGDILYLSQGSVYEMQVMQKYDFICINLFFDCDDKRKPDIFTPKDAEKCENLFYRALKEGSSATSAAKMSTIYRIYNEIILSRKVMYLSGSSRSKIDEAIAIMSDDVKADVSISELAKRTQMSEVYFRKLFKSVTGISPAKFMIDLRISRAKSLLSAESLSLDEVAERCGFSSLSYFCRVFKSNTGMTPSEFINRLTQRE